MKERVLRDVSRMAFELGLTSEYVLEKVGETLEVAREKGIDFSQPTIVGYDAQGPQVRVIDASFTPLINVQKAMLSIYPSLRVFKLIISGWDLSTLRFFRDRRLGMPELGLIGELGSVFEDKGKIFRINPIPDEEHHRLKQRIFVEAAKAGLKIAIQGNNSNRVVCIYFEGDDPDRGDLKSHFLVQGMNVQISDLYELIRDKTQFRFDGEKISFEPSLENIRAIDWILGRERPFNSVRLSEEDGTISIRIDDKDNRDFSLEDMKRFVTGIVSQDWEIDPSSDFCVDFVYRGDNVFTSKEEAANIFARRKSGTERYVITNVADMVRDVFEGENTIFFPLRGTQAEKHCMDHGIPHVSVINAVDYSLIMAAILNEEVPSWELEIEDISISAT